MGGGINLFAGSSSTKTGGDIRMVSGTGKTSGSISVRTSNAGSSGVSGELTFKSGVASSGSSGTISFITGNSVGGKGGSIYLSVGAGSSSSGGSISIRAGDGQTSGGDVHVEGGDSASGQGGNVYLKGGINSPESAAGGDVIFSVGSGASSIVFRDRNTNALATLTSSSATIHVSTSLSSPFTVQSWKMGSNGNTVTAILRGTVVIDCSGGNSISSNGERDIDFSASGVSLKDYVVMNPASDAVASNSILWSSWVRTTNEITIRISNFGSSTYSTSGTWVWFVIRSLS